MEMYEEFFYPYQKMVADAMNKPWAFHSDGNLFPILPGLLKLGMNAIHPIQPAAMDIGKMKEEYGSRVCLIGNIDLDYTLTLGTPEEVDREVLDSQRSIVFQQAENRMHAQKALMTWLLLHQK